MVRERLVIMWMELSVLTSNDLVCNTILLTVQFLPYILEWTFKQFRRIASYGFLIIKCWSFWISLVLVRKASMLETCISNQALLYWWSLNVIVDETIWKLKLYRAGSRNFFTPRIFIIEQLCHCFSTMKLFWLFRFLIKKKASISIERESMNSIVTSFQCKR